MRKSLTNYLQYVSLCLLTLRGGNKINQSDLQAIADLTAETLNVKIPPVLVKNVQRGRANSRYITIPVNVLLHHEVYCIYYIVHEVCHYLQKGHGPLFQKLEEKALSLWGITIERKRVYPKSLSIDGQGVWFCYSRLRLPKGVLRVK